MTMKLIDKDAVVSWVTEKREAALYRQHNLEKIGQETVLNEMIAFELNKIISFLDTLEVKDPYEQCVQYPSVKDAIQAHAETYSFNIESKLFNQLTKEQQVLWRKEIEQACISGGEAGLELAKDKRYEENKVKEVDLDKEIQMFSMNLAMKENNGDWEKDIAVTAKHFFELGLKAKEK